VTEFTTSMDINRRLFVFIFRQWSQKD